MKRFRILYAYFNRCDAIGKAHYYMYIRHGIKDGTRNDETIFLKEGLKVLCSRGWFRSTDLWVMGPARFLCATLLKSEGSTLRYNF